MISELGLRQARIDTVPKKCERSHIFAQERRSIMSIPRVLSFGDNVGWCSKCGSWVFTEKTFCICCRKRVKHKVHHRHTKQVLDNAILMNKELIDEYRIMPYSKQIWVETEWKGRRYMIPIKYLVLWEDHPNKNEIMDMVLDEITTVRN